MQQKRMIDLLQDQYHLTADRKTIRHNVTRLIELGYPVEHCQEGWYYEHEFSDSELRLLLDSLPETLSASNRDHLRHKLSRLGSRYFTTWEAGSKAPADQELLYTLDVLQEAIRKRCCVVFHYGHYDIDKQLHLKSHHDGRPRDYRVSPYRTVIASGHYILLGNTQPYDGVTHYRVDRIRSIRLLEKEKARPQNEMGVSIANLANYLSQRPYMFADEARPVRIRIQRKLAGEVLDWFGMDVHFLNATENTVDVDLSASLTAMRYWALQFGEQCEVLQPA